MLIVLFKKCLYLKGIFYLKFAISWAIRIDTSLNKNHGASTFFLHHVTCPSRFVYLGGTKHGCDVGALFKHLNHYSIESS